MLEEKLSAAEGDKDDMGDDLKDEMTKLRNRCAQYEERIKQLDEDLKSMTQAAGGCARFHRVRGPCRGPPPPPTEDGLADPGR